MTNAADKRIAELEAALRRADERIREFEAERAFASNDGGRPMVRVLPPEAAKNFACPTQSELRQLFGIATAALVPLKSGAESFERFKAAFGYACGLSRMPAGKFSVLANDAWVDRASASTGSEVSLRDFTLALLAVGFHPTTYDRSRWPYDFDIGVVEGAGDMPTEASWRATLARGKPLPPVERRRQAEPSPSRVVVIGCPPLLWVLLALARHRVQPDRLGNLVRRAKTTGHGRKQESKNATPSSVFGPCGCGRTSS